MKNTSDPITDLACVAIQKLTGKTPNGDIIQILVFVIIAVAAIYLLAYITAPS